MIVEGYTDVMAMHLAGVPTAVATCGTAFGAEHIAVLRRLLGDDSFDLGEVIFTFDGDEAGKAAALKAFEGEQQFVAQTFVAIAPDGLDPCELRQRHGDTALRDLVARREPLFEFAIRSLLAEHDLDTAEGQVAALRSDGPAGRPDQGRRAARRVRQAAGRLGGLGRRGDGGHQGAGERRRTRGTRSGPQPNPAAGGRRPAAPGRPQAARCSGRP